MFLRSLDTTFSWEVKGHTRIDDTGKPYQVGNYQEPHQTSTQLKVFFNLSLYCGFRKGETLALHWSDIDFEKREIKISKAVGKAEDGVTIKKPKTATSVRTVTFPEEILPLLKQYRREYNTYRLSLGDQWKGDGNLFIQWDGKLMGLSTTYQYFKRHLRIYTDCATLLNYLGINLIDISKILGHAKSSTTMDIYAHSFDGQNKEAANRIDEFLQEKRLKQA